MFDPVKDIEDFHKKYGLAYEGKPRHLVGDLKAFRQLFMEEELTEYALAYSLVDKLDALVDLVYVALGTAYLHGFDFREAWRRVHEANMKKIRASRANESKRGTSLDVVKPPGWQAPDLSDLA